MTGDLQTYLPGSVVLSASVGAVNTASAWTGFRTCHGRFMSAQPMQSKWILVGDRTQLLGWETFLVIQTGTDKVALRTCHGRFVSAQPNGTVVGDRTIAQSWETWTVIRTGSGSVAFRSFHGKFLSAQPASGGWGIVANRTQIAGWESFAGVAPPQSTAALEAASPINFAPGTLAIMA